MQSTEYSISVPEGNLSHHHKKKNSQHDITNYHNQIIRIVR